MVAADGEHDLQDSAINSHVWKVLLRLRLAGHDTYLVGGAIRDVLLGGTPKDTDILTTATTKEVRRLFKRAMIVGRAFPICHVPAGPLTLEVSSFGTTTAGVGLPPDAAARAAALGAGGALTHDAVAAAERRRAHRLLRDGGPGEGAQDPAPDNFLLPQPSWSQARRDNAIQRDFTVNGLLYEPFSRTLYDYVGGLQDCRNRVLRTIGPAAPSFQTDPARMLRALRLAARAGLALEAGTRRALVQGVHQMAGLNLARVQMEIHAMLAYGSAASSLDLMWRYHAMDVVLPQVAAHLAACGAPRDRRRSKRPSPLLFRMAEVLDRHASPLRPLSVVAWTATLMAGLMAPGLRRLHDPEASSSQNPGEEAAVPRRSRRSASWRARRAARRRPGGDEAGPSGGLRHADYLHELRSARACLGEAARATAPPATPVVAGSPCPRMALDSAEAVLLRCWDELSRGAGERRRGKRGAEDLDAVARQVVDVLRDPEAGWLEACGMDRQGVEQPDEAGDGRRDAAKTGHGPGDEVSGGMDAPPPSL
ncbi:PAP4 [Auxenochlorella protothecoides x Auxenochlorella symbiontica]